MQYRKYEKEEKMDTLGYKKKADGHGNIKKTKTFSPWFQISSDTKNYRQIKPKNLTKTWTELIKRCFAVI